MIYIVHMQSELRPQSRNGNQLYRRVPIYRDFVPRGQRSGCHQGFQRMIISTIKQRPCTIAARGENSRAVNIAVLLLLFFLHLAFVLGCQVEQIGA